MIADETAHPPDEPGDADDRRIETAAPVGRTRQIMLALQVRLRFVVVLGAAFLVVGLWGNLRNVFDTWRHRFGGSHSGQHSVSIDTEFFCPMCPGVVSDWPAICPVCNMDLVRRKKGEAMLLPEGVVARMQLSPYRIQLAGIATSVVVAHPLAREITMAGRLVDFPPRDSSPDGPESSPASPARLALECTVPNSDLSLLAPGRKAQVTLDEVGTAASLIGHVEHADLAADHPPGRRSAIVHIRLPMRPRGARPGMYGTARVAVPLSRRRSRFRLAAEDFQAGRIGRRIRGRPRNGRRRRTGSRRVVVYRRDDARHVHYDGVEVTLGPRCGDYYPVIKGLESGQKVATVGAFLIDAEARLSPDLAAAYFGQACTHG